MKVLTLLGTIFGGVGAALLVAAGLVYFTQHSFENTATKTTGVVVDLSHNSGSNSSSRGSYAPVVSFKTVEGQDFTFVSSVSSSPPAYDIGEAVDVLYDPADPSDAMIDSFWQKYLLPGILGIVGFTFFALGSGLFIGRALQRRKQRELMLRGRRVATTIQGVNLNTNVRVNGRHPFCITSQWLNPDTGELHVFKSEGMWYDPTMHLSGPEIDVLIDPANPKRYHVDTSFLPKEA